MFNVYNFFDSSGQDEDEDELRRAIAASMEGVTDIKKEVPKETETITKEAESKVSIPVYPPLPEEPKGDRSLLCTVGVRLPDGRRIKRNFLRTDPIQVNILLESNFISYNFL